MLLEYEQLQQNRSQTAFNTWIFFTLTISFINYSLNLTFNGSKDNLPTQTAAAGICSPQRSVKNTPAALNSFQDNDICCVWLQVFLRAKAKRDRETQQGGGGRRGIM